MVFFCFKDFALKGHEIDFTKGHEIYFTNRYMTYHFYFFEMIAFGVNFPNIYGVHSVESLEMLCF